MLSILLKKYIKWHQCDRNGTALPFLVYFKSSSFAILQWNLFLQKRKVNKSEIRMRERERDSSKMAHFHFIYLKCC